MLLRSCFVRVLVAFALLMSSLIVCGADLQEIRSRGELRHLGIRYANFVTGSGEGFDVELVQGFASHLGVRYTLVYSDFYSIIRDLLGQEVVRSGHEVTLSGSYPVKGDMIATGFTVLPWRKAVLRYSQPTFPSQVLVIAPAASHLQPIKGSRELRKDIDETKSLIAKQSLLVMEKTCLDPSNYGLKGGGMDLRPYTQSTNINEMVPALLDGRAQLSLLDAPSMVLDLRKWSGRIKVIGPVSEHQELAAAFPKDAPELQQAFDTYLAMIRADGRYDRLVDKYYPGIRRIFPEFFARQ